MLGIILKRMEKMNDSLDQILADEAKMASVITQVSTLITSLNTEIANLQAANQENDPAKLSEALTNADALVAQLNGLIPATPAPVGPTADQSESQQ